MAGSLENRGKLRELIDKFKFGELRKSGFGDWINLVFVVKTFILGRCYGK